MIKLHSTLTYDGKDTSTPNEPISQYQPDESMRERMKLIQMHTEILDEARRRPYEEFNGNTLINEINKSAEQYNENTEPLSSDLTQRWKSNIIRPLTRNKVRAIASHVASNILYPGFSAQNQNDKEDKALALIMEDAAEWALNNDKYEEKFIDIVMDMLVYPACFVHQGFSKVKRKIKKLTADGDYKIEEVVNELYSGFKLMIVPVEDIYIPNFHEPDLQKQPYMGHHRIISIEEAKEKYGHHENFTYVKPGTRTFFSDEHGMFFEKNILELEEHNVDEFIYYNKGLDIEIAIVGGIPMTTDPERPMQRADKMYPYAVNGFERVSSQFFYFKSLVKNLKGLQDEIDIMHRMLIDGTYLKMMPPLGYYGEDSLDNSVFIPGSIIPFTEETDKIAPIQTGFDLNAGYNTLAKLEAEASESSASEFLTGMPLSKEMTKFEIMKLEENAATKLGLFGKRLSFLVRDIGELLKNNILQHMPISEVIETLDGTKTIMFHSLLLENKEIEGSRGPREINFLPDTQMTPEELAKKQHDILKEEMSDEEPTQPGELNMERSIYYVNINLFKNAKYKATVTPKFSDRITDLMKRERYYDRAIMNPTSDKAELLRFIGRDYVPGEEDRFIMKRQPQQPEEPQQPAATFNAETEL